MDHRIHRLYSSFTIRDSFHSCILYDGGAKGQVAVVVVVEEDVVQDSYEEKPMHFHHKFLNVVLHHILSAIKKRTYPVNIVDHFG